MSTTTTPLNLNHYLYSTTPSGHTDSTTGESVPRVICSCGKSFTLWHVTVSPEEYIAQHARFA